MTKQNIRLVTVDSALELWLLEKLLQDPPDSPCAPELLNTVRDILSGKQHGILLSPDAQLIKTVGLVSTDCLTAGDLELYPKTRRVRRQGEEISLTPKEFDILYFLAENRGEVFTKEQIYRAVWADDYLLDDSNIMAFIRKLRKKIEPHPDAPKYIQTIWGIGYKFNDQP